MLRGVGTIIAAVLIAIALVAIVAFAYYMLDLLRGYQTSLAEIAGTKAAASLLAGGVTGWYLDTTTTLRIHLESSNPYTILVTTITILWSDSTHTVYDSQNTPTASFTATVDTGAASYTVDRLPIAMGPGYTVDIYIDKTALGKDGVDVKTVSVTLSASPVVAVVPLKDYYQLYPNATVAANATQPPAASLYALLASAPGDYTKTIYGTIVGTLILKDYGNVTGYNVTVGSLVSGSAEDLSRPDSSTLRVEAQKSIIVAGFSITSDNLIYATDFEDGNVFTSNEWSTVGGSWYWDTNLGYQGAGINQTDTTTNGGVGNSGEYFAYPAGVTAPTAQAYYVMSQIYTADIGFHDVVLADVANGELYEYSIYIAGSSIEIWRYSGGWGGGPLASTTADVAQNTWYTSLVYYDPNTGYMNLTVIDENGNWWSVDTTDTVVTPVEIGVGTWASAARFDNFIASYADPRFVNITVLLDGTPVQGWRVELYADYGAESVANATTDANGVAMLDVTWHPIIRNALLKIYDDTGALIAEVFTGNYELGTLYGGNNYQLDLATRYTVIVEVNSTVLDSYIAAGPAAYFEVNASSGYEVYAYNWSTGMWTLIWQSSSSGNTQLEKLYPREAGLVSPSNYTLRVRAVIYAADPLQVSFDALTAVYTYPVTSSFRGLILAVGGTSSIEVYKDTGSSLEHLYTINSSTFFNGSAAIAYNAFGSKLVLVNSTGVYETYVGPNATWSLVTNECNASTAGGVEAEVVNASNVPILIVLRGGGDEYCAVDLASGTVTDTGRLSTTLPGITVDLAYVYPASAAPGNETAYFLAYNQTSASPVILKADATPTGTVSWSLYTAAPGARSTGLAAAQTSLWLLLERGSLYKITPTGTTLVNQTLPIVPWGPGDRLEDYNATHLLWIRADGTREAWLIEKG